MEQKAEDITGLATPWPAEELEEVDTCPVCGSGSRVLLHENLTDEVFFCAPGQWVMYRCSDCGSGYLDPRPSPASIGAAYGQYFTHKEPRAREDGTLLSGWRRARRALAHGYINQQYGTNLEPAYRMGAFGAHLVPGLKRRLDLRYRFLPKPTSGARLLDVGCGNGTFLSWAKLAGWEVYGVEPDPKAVEQARSRGAGVRQGSVEAFSDKVDYFSAVTLSHVIEHLHDPVSVLRQIRNMMRTDGTVYIDTPNLESLGHKRFGRHWRGLEPPRHLVIFTRDSLIGLLEEVGFHSIRLIRRTEVPLYIYPTSVMLTRNLDPYCDRKPKPMLSAHIARMRGHLNTRCLEFITLIAKS